MKKRIEFMNTAFRDGFQSVYGARVLTKDFLPAVEAAKAAGINHFEAGGGARFQSLYFYCNEDAFDMMDQFRIAAGPDSNLQTLSRGVNVVGLESQTSDIINLHAKLFKKHGMTTIRNFDALNDVNNLIYSGQCIVDAGLRHEICITMMELPPGCVGAHTPEFYMQTLRNILDANIPFDAICFKDASGTSVPDKVYETISQARKLLGDDIRISFHTHETAGLSIIQYKAAMAAGVNQIDLSMTPVSGGTCQPDIMTMYHALLGTEWDLGIVPAKIFEAEEIFKECMKDYFVPPESKKVEPTIPLSPMPGGALTANTQMLRDNNLLDKYEEITKYMGKAVAKGGFGTSVTPVSQFYFQQAFNNTMFGNWQKIAEGYGKMVLGYFGKTPVPADPDVIKIASQQLKLEPTTKTVQEINDNNPNLGVKATEMILIKNDIEITDENVFIAATCREKGIAFLQGNGVLNIRKIEKETSSVSGDGYTVSVNGKKYAVTFQGDKAIVDGKSYDVGVTEGIVESDETTSTAEAGSGYAVNAPMPGLVLRISVKEGDAVDEGDELIIVEAMKMETPVMAPRSGTVESISVDQGEQVQGGQFLLEIV
ncbi:MAG: biotin attachment protein [Spirochaetaceae bacterium]|jgi:pyruvate carboxylase subunit B|nr:biotin attachment protein [Spirochaetaceae bacterium]